KPLRELSLKYNFLIFEDRKFGDIDNAVKKQYSGGIYKISEWADIVSVHSVVGPTIVESLKSVHTAPYEKGCLLIAEMNCEGSLLKKSNIDASFKIGKLHNDFVIGFISQSQITTEPHKLHFTPGVKIGASGDSLWQRFVTPEDAILKRGADVIIVGRGITEAKDKISAAKEYQRRGFSAYESKISSASV
ncbi:uridine 5', partial [Dinothrombium tinctorium]